MKLVIFKGYLKFINLITESIILSQNSEIIEIFESNDLRLRAILGASKCLTSKLRLLIHIILKLFLKHIKLICTQVSSQFWAWSFRLFFDYISGGLTSKI